MVFDGLILIEIAFVLKPHGLNGFVSVKTIENYSEKQFYKGMPVFLKTEGIPVPFFIEDIKYSGGNPVIKLKHINDSDSALRFKDCSIFIKESDIREKEVADIQQSELLGYAVYDKNRGFIGNISLFNEIPGNPVFETQFDNKTIIIPFSEKIILQISHNTKTINIDAPDGLIDIYLAE